ncbi:MAG: serine/threonine protein kinase [Blastocatellia bacterium]|nr:serine/threonine protein kinase [Blastocatellia bacterium]
MKNYPAIKMNRLTLSFNDKEVEADFIRNYLANSARQARFAMILGVLLWLGSGIIDYWISQDYQRLWFIRFVVITPIILCLFFLALSAWGAKAMQFLAVVFCLIPGIGIALMTLKMEPPGKYLYHVCIIEIIAYIYTFIRLRFIYAAALSWLLSVVYLLIALPLIKIEIPVLINNAYAFLTVNSVGMAACYFMEYYVRQNFLQSREIEAQTARLEEKNTELTQKNKELVRAKEDILQSSKRAELIFAALSEALPGTVLDNKYQLQEKIGSGGFGTVYRAVHLQLNRPVAIKVFRPVGGNDIANSLGRFRTEGISACRVHHENAVAVLDFGTSAASIAYLVMELLEGRSLAEELAEKGKLSPLRSARILIPVCSVLASAHAVGLVHRDIKPSNIFLHKTNQQEVVKVVDFGVAKLMNESPDANAQSLTVTGALVGTPFYMAPERFEDKPYDGRVDVYSTGAMLYEMLCGCLPFRTQEKGLLAIAGMHLTQEPRPLRNVNPHVPESLEAIVLKALAKNPAERPTADELRRQLIHFVSIWEQSANASEIYPQSDGNGFATNAGELTFPDTI